MRKCLIPHHFLTNFEIQRYYQNISRFNVYSRKIYQILQRIDICNKS